MLRPRKTEKLPNGKFRTTYDICCPKCKLIMELLPGTWTTEKITYRCRQCGFQVYWDLQKLRQVADIIEDTREEWEE